MVVGVALFAALLDSLFLPSGPTVPPIIVGVMTVAALAFLVGGLFSGK